MFFSLLPTLFYALASTAGAMLYPSFMSFKAIKTGKDTRVWLEYWIVFAIWRVFEWSVIDNLDLGSWPIVAIKLVFLGWLVFYHGASLIYKSGLEKQLVLHEKTTDGNLEQVGDLAVFEWSVIDNLDLGSWPIVAIKLVFLGWLVFYHGASLIYKVHGMELVKKVAAGVYAQLAAKGATDADPASAPAAPPKAAKTPKADEISHHNFCHDVFGGAGPVSEVAFKQKSPDDDGTELWAEGAYHQQQETRSWHADAA
eukprot:CAMPEP_0180114126 /NCGR_PEP_ID=MMETSP0985-20121206/37135_1 /TAXON_ID=483367 /ORGANISM="non described non described, Strain CCMP 2436" /LENGTH=254 /DNA_ID=CAMNT_0022052647 /DNA_START=42 /DNA_END=807 /DNA_ORIENTATION=+